jgi:hypothetical protein
MRSLLPTMLVLLTGAPLLADSHSLQAQNSSGAHSGTWVTPAVGFTNVGMLGGLDVSRLRAPMLYRFRYTVQAGMGTGATQGISAVDEGALMIGRAGVRDLGQDGQRWTGGNRWSVAAGAGILKVDRQEGESSATTVGISAEAQLISRRSPHLSVTVIANLNAEVPFAGILLGLPLGRMPWP